MTSTTSNTIGKVAALAAGFALVAMSFAVAPAAHAQTTTTTTTSMAAPMFTTDLTVGSTGASVSALQTWLISKGYSIPAGATGYFGTQTKAAVAAFQTANGISPAAGYFGPITRAKANAMGGSTTGGTTTVSGCAPGAAYSSTTGQPCSSTTTGGGTLTGGEGTINNFQIVGANNVTLGAGATQQVYGFQFVAGGSDLSVNRIYYDVYNTTLTGTTRPWVIFQNATLKDGSGTVVATIDATNQANWSQDGTAANGNQIYRLSYENVNNVVKMNATQTYYLTLSTQGAFATNTYGGVYSVALAPQGMRATDALGLQQYSTSNAATASLVTVNNNATGSVVLSTGSNNPQTQTLMANQNTATQNVTVNTFTLQNNGSAALELYSLPVTLSTATTSAFSAPYYQASSQIVQDVKLWQGTTLLDTESPSSTFVSGGTLNFKNLNFALPVGNTQSFSITADIQPIGGSNPAPSGVALTLTVPGTTADIETASGAIVAPTSASTGNILAFATQGLTVDAVPAAGSWSITTSGNGNQQTGTYNFTFNVTAFGQDIYVSSTTSGFLPLTVNDGNGNATTTAAATISSTADRSAGGNYVIHSGQTKSITIGFTKQGQNGVVQAKLSTLKYGTADTLSGVVANSYTLPSAYQSPQQFLAD